MKETLKISGMTCAACASRIEKVVGKIEGINSVSVNLATEKMTVEANESKVSLQDIIKGVEKAGYKAESQAAQGSNTLKIIGMTCAACATRIEKVVAKIDGVKSVTVNLATERLTCEIDPQKTNMAAVRQAVEKAGYKWAEVASKASVDEDKIRKEKEIKTLWRKFTVAAVFTVPLLYIAMGTMLSWFKGVNIL